MNVYDENTRPGNPWEPGQAFIYQHKHEITSQPDKSHRYISARSGSKSKQWERAVSTGLKRAKTTVAVGPAAPISRKGAALLSLYEA